MTAADPASPLPAFGSGEAHTAVPERSGGTHFASLDAYRGIGMTMVLMNHAAYTTGWISNPESFANRYLAPIVARFDLSVPMFFVMSGFLLYRPFAKAVFDERPALAALTFYRRRVLRILPAYWFALVALGLLVGLSIPGWKSWLANALFLPAFGVPVNVCNQAGSCHVAYGITQAWSIGVEVTFYLLLPLYAALVARLCRGREPSGKLAVLLSGLLVLYLGSTAFRAFVVQANPSWAEQSLLWLPMFLDLFAIGMALSVLSIWAARNEALPRAFTWLGEHAVASWMIAGVIFAVVTRLKYPDRPFGLHSQDGSSDYLPRQFLYGLASAIWLFPSMFGDQSVGRLRRVLASRPLVYLGAISLSFYLWHLAIIDKVKAWTIPNYEQIQLRATNPQNPLEAIGTFTGNFLLVAALSWIISLLVASVLFRIIELPFLRLKDEPLRALWPSRSPTRDGRRP